MRSILTEFAYGNINPELQPDSKQSELGEAFALVDRIEEKFRARLHTEEVELLERFTEAHIELNRLTAVQNLLYGYKLGVVMTAEAFVTSDDLIA